MLLYASKVWKFRKFFCKYGSLLPLQSFAWCIDIAQPFIIFFFLMHVFIRRTTLALVFWGIHIYAVFISAICVCNCPPHIEPFDCIRRSLFMKELSICGILPFAYTCSQSMLCCKINFISQHISIYPQISYKLTNKYCLMQYMSNCLPQCFNRTHFISRDLG